MWSQLSEGRLKKHLGKKRVAISQIAFIIALAIANKMEGEDSCEKLTLPIPTCVLHV